MSAVCYTPRVYLHSGVDRFILASTKNWSSDKSILNLLYQSILVIEVLHFSTTPYSAIHLATKLDWEINSTPSSPPVCLLLGFFGEGGGGGRRGRIFQAKRVRHSGDSPTKTSGSTYTAQPKHTMQLRICLQSKNKSPVLAAQKSKAVTKSFGN